MILGKENITCRVVLWCYRIRRGGLCSAPGSVFQGKASEDRKTSGDVRKFWGESKVRKQVGCLQYTGKQILVWESIGQPVVEMARGTAKAEISQHR